MSLPVTRLARSCGALAALALAGASLVAAITAGVIFLSTAQDAWTAIAAPGPAGPADGILLAAGLAGALLSFWLGVGMALSALAALPGAVGHGCRWLAGRIAPAAVRKVVVLVLGTTMTAALVPGNAVSATGHDRPRPAAAAARRVSGAGRAAADTAPDASFRLVSNPVHGRDARDDNDREDNNREDNNREDMDAAPPPSWSAEGPASSRAVSQSPAAPHVRAFTADGVLVHRGDTLWSIAAAHLVPTAAAADIDAEWHRWFAVNRAVIGDDPDLILPGQLLSPPPSPQERERS